MQTQAPLLDKGGAFCLNSLAKLRAFLADFESLSHHVLSEGITPRPRSFMVRNSNLPRLERELRRILSALKYGDNGLVKIWDKEDTYFFRKAKEILKGRGMMNVIDGYWDKGNRAKCRAAMYSPTERLLPALREWRNADPIQIREPKERQKKFLMKEWNEEYAKHSYIGCDVPVLVRYLKDKKGKVAGRMYAIGRNRYQQRKDRWNIRIDGRGCVEVDISASHLTAYLCLCGSDFKMGLGERDDLYGIDPKIPRECVKLAIMLILGKGTTKGLSWYQVNDGEPPPPDHPCWKHKIQKVVDRVVQEYPDLAKVEPEHRPLLVWKEAEIVFDTVSQLMAKGIVALPAHDSILVPAEHEKECESLLTENFRKAYGRAPRLKVDRPLLKATPWPSADPIFDIEILIQEVLEAAMVVRFSNRDLSYPNSNNTHTQEQMVTLQLTPQFEKRTRGGNREGAGRKRQYASPAEQKRAYRQRKKERKPQTL